MDIFDLSPEDLSALALLISIGLAKQYTSNEDLGVLALFFTAIGDNLGLIVLQRVTLARRTEELAKSELNK